MAKDKRTPASRRPARIARDRAVRIPEPPRGRAVDAKAPSPRTAAPRPARTPRAAGVPAARRTRAPRPAAGSDRGCYVYCIIRATRPLRFGPIGIDDRAPAGLHGHLSRHGAVVSDVPIAPLDSTRENVLAHERVNETVMRDYTVIPMSFGTSSRPTTTSSSCCDRPTTPSPTCSTRCRTSSSSASRCCGIATRSFGRSSRRTRTSTGSSRRSPRRRGRPTSRACSTAG
jgi:hypothetical protein